MSDQAPPPPPPPEGEPPNYGQPAYGQPAYGQPAYGQPYGGAAVGNNKKALWSMIVGIISLFCCGIVTGIVAIVLSRQAKSEIAQTGQGGGGMATAGLVLGIVGIVGSIGTGIWALNNGGLSG
jgi:Domain of unknown function (DUF4190)